MKLTNLKVGELMDITKRKLKNRYPISSTVSLEVYSKLCEVSDKTKIAKSKILDIALEDYFKKIEKEGE